MRQQQTKEEGSWKGERVGSSPANGFERNWFLLLRRHSLEHVQIEKLPLGLGPANSCDSVTMSYLCHSHSFFFHSLALKSKMKQMRPFNKMLTMTNGFVCSPICPISCLSSSLLVARRHRRQQFPMRELNPFKRMPNAYTAYGGAIPNKMLWFWCRRCC